MTDKIQATQALAQRSAQTPEAPPVLPAVDVVEDASGISLYADMPGVPKDRLSLHVEGDQLTIEGEIVLPAALAAAPGHAEVAQSRFRRTFTLSKELDADKVGAELAQGVLRVRIPKAAHAQPRKIEVNLA